MVCKKDGGSPSIRAVDAVIAQKTQHPEWRGQDSQAGGRPSLLTAVRRKALVRLVFAWRGKAKVTIKFCKQRLPYSIYGI